jgi:anti-anti-sigma factor
MGAHTTGDRDMPYVGGSVPLLNVALVPAPDQVVVRLTGEADLSSTPLLADALRQASSLGTRQVVVDVAAVRFWDLSGLYALVDFTADLAAFGRSCRIVAAPAATRRLIELAALGHAMNLDGRLDELPNRVLPLPAVPTTRRPVPEHAVPTRVYSGSDRVPAGGPASSAGRRLWRRRDR